MTPQLVALSEGPNLLVDKPILLVGRHQECDVQIPSRKISRKHCCIAQVADYIYIRDMFSTNGIRINGDKVPEGIIRHGDEVTIGNMKYRLDWQTNGSRLPAPSLMAALTERPPVPQDYDALVSSESPIMLNEETGLPPIPTGRPLVLPVRENPV